MFSNTSQCETERKKDKGVEEKGAKDNHNITVSTELDSDRQIPANRCGVFEAFDLLER